MMFNASTIMACVLLFACSREGEVLCGPSESRSEGLRKMDGDPSLMRGIPTCLESFHRGPAYKAKTRHTQSRGPPFGSLLGQNRGTLPPRCCSCSTAECRRPGGIRGAPQDDPAGARRWNHGGTSRPEVSSEDVDLLPTSTSPPTTYLTALRPQISNARTMDGGSSGERCLMCCN